MTSKQLDAAIEQAWYKQADGVQVGIMDIPKIFKDVKKHVTAGGTIADGVDIAIQAYRVN